MRTLKRIWAFWTTGWVAVDPNPEYGYWDRMAGLGQEHPEDRRS